MTEPNVPEGGENPDVEQSLLAMYEVWLVTRGHLEGSQGHWERFRRQVVQQLNRIEQKYRESQR